MRSGVIWNGIHFEGPVIPAKAGIQPVETTFPDLCKLDSRFRGNDCNLQCSCLANDARKGKWTSTSGPCSRDAQSAVFNPPQAQDPIRQAFNLPAAAFQDDHFEAMVVV